MFSTLSTARVTSTRARTSLEVNRADCDGRRSIVAATPLLLRTTSRCCAAASTSANNNNNNETHNYLQRKFYKLISEPHYYSVPSLPLEVRLQEPSGQFDPSHRIDRTTISTSNKAYTSLRSLFISIITLSIALLQASNVRVNSEVSEVHRERAKIFKL